MSGAWSLRGELVLSCSCAVFCPCTLSLGLAPPTEGYCQTWAGIRIDEGRFDDTDLSGVKVGLIIEIPGLMSRGNWTAGLFVDDHASIHAVKALTRIFTGRAGGSTHLLSILVSHFLGVQQAPIEYRTEERRASFRSARSSKVPVTPVVGKNKDEPVVIRNSEYWVAPEITVARAEKSRVCACSDATGISPAARPKSANSNWVTGPLGAGW